MNYVFFFPDEIRAESVSCYGHPLVQMPNYDRLAHQGTRFAQCHVQHPVCSPSRCSLMTGWYPHVRGHRTLWHLLRPDEPSLFGYLRQAGYHIEWHGKNDLYAPETLATCVDHWHQASGGHAGDNAFGPQEVGYQSFLYQAFPGAWQQTADMRNVQAGIDFLRRRRSGDAPFFLYLPLSMPHPPYAAPEPFHSMYRPDDLPTLRPADLPDKPDYHALIRRYRQLDRLDEAVFRQIQATYLGMNSYVDWMLGQLLDALDETGLADDTTVIVSSDHGDWAGDYGLAEKWPSALDDTLTRVPLIIRTPGGAADHLVPEPVELFDLLPTVLDLSGIAAQHTHWAHTLCPQLAGASGDPARAVFAEGGYDLNEPHCFEGRAQSDDLFRDPSHIYYPKGLQQQEHPLSVCRAAMIRTMRHKLVHRPHGVSELYDLQQDPRELDNRHRDTSLADVRSQLEARLLDWLLTTADVTPYDENPRGLPAARLPTAG
jgi:choline-sulfatase